MRIMLYISQVWSEKCEAEDIDPVWTEQGSRNPEALQMSFPRTRTRRVPADRELWPRGSLLEGEYHIVSTVITLWSNTTDINNLHRPSWPCRLPVVSLCCIHWQGEDFEVFSNEIEQLSIEEIQETLQIQQFKRSVLLSQVKDSPTAVVTEIRLQDHEAVLDLSQNINTVLLLCGWIHKTNALKCVSIVWWWKFLIPNIIL